jgi:hypothetical protein
MASLYSHHLASAVRFAAAYWLFTGCAVESGMARTCAISLHTVATAGFCAKVDSLEEAMNACGGNLVDVLVRCIRRHTHSTTERVAELPKAVVTPADHLGLRTIFFSNRTRKETAG